MRPVTETIDNVSKAASALVRTNGTETYDYGNK